MRLMLLADGDVGLSTCRWLVENYPSDVALVVSSADVNELRGLAITAGAAYIRWSGSADLVRILADEPAYDLGLLAWWPHIIKEPLLSMPRLGFINFHPSLLPFNRGKHYNFWALVEQSPFGVTLHRVVENIDEGPVLFQRRIPYDWLDTGGTLYHKAQESMLLLFKESYLAIREGDLIGVQQDITQGSLHYSKEIESASQIELDAPTTARKLLNLIRARTFPGKPSCQFIDSGRHWEVRISIQEKT